MRRESLKEYIRYYPITSLILIINIVLFIIMEVVGSTSDMATMINFGAMFRLSGFSPEWWRYFASMFLHFGFMHLLMNCFALYVFAPPLERMIGSFRYLLFYLLSGFSGSLISYLLMSERTVSAGASGAVYGVFAAYLFLAIFRKDVLDAQSGQTIKTILIVGLIYSLLPGVSFFGHLGGFIGGFALMAIFSLTMRRLR
ncbi:rhomboid family intramembrane serine protease [Paenibacillus senegalensis]|uniref:rhomboid family intramembrane serine protease n=1 Tax=Paenibacillus senegalensis TaxID=1465766 RepID=UPI001F17FE8D|nr:rhomboid family intramembrane serine protease [Paenibacillus senegalensis]